MPSQAKLQNDLRKLEQAGRKLKSAANDLDRQAKRSDRELRQLQSRLRSNATRSRPVVDYTPDQVRHLEPTSDALRELHERKPDLRDVFLCHAWPDRNESARELHDHLESFGASVWFSEKDVRLGEALTRRIDQGLRDSKLGVVLVTPNMIQSLRNEGIADKELAALLRTNRVIPVLHGLSFDELNDESPLLASRAGLSTEENSLEEIAAMIADTIDRSEATPEDA
ncbi:toll/interleukin-1 receptor domain-containing protein [Aeromicrobium sp. YIM 150415]|uniref:toll/interleukin-1 receptor domain-containing protein n=1 Tax=Aeromicrobium sp. YIM 150415 TaxID=2803912 RepID=UPI0019649F7E|nr:toll/interleukin-1 receptor domain-containing protein [Aeromicrobium sp. YIM 150415]MBM9463838.1 toll/interleukin-1 receptor domain-containing protein [Aeromicrobium sp. YIM 150415]